MKRFGLAPASSTYLFAIIMISVGVNLMLAWQVWAGSPDSPGLPTATSSFTLADLYNRLNTGTAGTPSTFTEPGTAPGTGTMHTLNDIMAKAPALDNPNGATPIQVLAGQTFWGLTAGQWGTTTGTMPNNGAVTLTPTTTNQTIAQGYHNGSGMVQGDSDLAAGNIKQGVNLFGVVGTLISGNIYNAGVPRTGQTPTMPIDPAPAGSDGALQRGVTWPSPRFTDNGNGTVTDNLTGLIWLKNANCFGLRDWETALTDANGLASGSCGLTDGSSAGNWRLPHLRELQSLIDYGRFVPALPTGHPFTNVQMRNYWSSSTYAQAQATNAAWLVNLTDGSLGVHGKTFITTIWPVRGG